MPSDEKRTHDLIDRALRGEPSARRALLDLHREDVRRMVEVRLDRRLRATAEAADVVQDAMVDAWRGLDDYLRDPIRPFFAWLRQIVDRRIETTCRRQTSSQPCELPRLEISDESAVVMAGQMFVAETGAGSQLDRQEFCERLKQALLSLAPKDRDVLVMRHIERLGIDEIASVLGTNQGHVKVRLLRALFRLERLMNRCL
jgi:RNA polymerase sigma-70 factor, ECF subfamily